MEMGIARIGTIASSNKNSSCGFEFRRKRMELLRWSHTLSQRHSGYLRVSGSPKKKVRFLFQKRDASFWSEKKYKCHLVSFVRFMFFQFKRDATKRCIKIACQVTKHCKCHRTCCRCYQATRLMNYQSWANDFNATPAGNKTLRPSRTLVVNSLIRPYILGGVALQGVPLDSHDTWSAKPISLLSLSGVG